MFKNVMLFFAFSAAVVTSSGVSALPIQNADAFSLGDNKAALEISTGLLWMDFGVTNNQSMASTLSQLGTTYTGWRLPTQTEVMHLWTSLFSGYPGWFSFGSFSYVNNLNLANEFNEIYDVLGANGTSIYQQYDNGELVGSEPIFGGVGYYLGENGSFGAAMMHNATTPGSTLGYTAITFDLYDPAVLEWQDDFVSTLLVKDYHASQVPEPSSVLLFVMGLAGLFFTRGRTKLRS